MKTFEEALEARLKELPYVPHLDDGGYNDGRIDGFQQGAEWAETNPELINEILTKYDKWVMDTARHKFPDWLYEEGDYDKTLARVRREFIEYLNK